MENFAPIALFAYNRANHTRQVLESLAQNALAKDSILYIFLDGLRAESSANLARKHKETREFLENFAQDSRDFKKIILHKRERNFGLADSIIDGTSRVMEAHGRAIILEDDIVVSPVFLEYMNIALKKYAHEPKVWSVCAWNYPIDSSDLEDCFFWRVPHCWGWASWANRWEKFRRDIAWVEANFNARDIYAINLDGYADYFGDFYLNKKGKIRSWAIFNYLICHKFQGLNLLPKITYIRQIGFDGSGVHCGKSDIFYDSRLNLEIPRTFPHYLEESKIALTRIQNFHAGLKKPLHLRVKNKLTRISKRAFNALTRERERESSARRVRFSYHFAPFGASFWRDSCESCANSRESRNFYDSHKSCADSCDSHNFHDSRHFAQKVA